MKNITILGMGAMGSRMAENILNNGYKLKIWNRTPDKCKPLVSRGAQQFLTAKEAVKNSDVVISMLSDDIASKSVWLGSQTGALTGLTAKTVVIECSTLTPSCSMELSSKVTTVGSEYIEAPVIGSRPQAENSQLLYLVGGETHVLDKVQTLLNVNSNAIHYIGAVGLAMSMKLAINGLFGVQVAALGEMLGMLNQIGVDQNTAITLLNKLPTTSPALAGIGLGISANNYSPLFPIDLVEKDFSYLLQLAKSKHCTTPLTTTTLDIYQHAQHSGLGNSNISGVAQLYLGLQ